MENNLIVYALIALVLVAIFSDAAHSLKTRRLDSSPWLIVLALVAICAISFMIK